MFASMRLDAGMESVSGALDADQRRGALNAAPSTEYQREKGQAMPGL
ncbi:hypothetical protein SAMN06265338_101155 [Rhodoblastus acidophilus]|uniref:Uncharacterized protein n=1 Tax=Rhodoblastus acidophilus TaxID=1074 RepID=A0A212PY17_RHOAC|nr:hypothetical protein SAMN06265338_101155 [Rhodoblastus acidophilus]